MYIIFMYGHNDYAIDLKGKSFNEQNGKKKN